MTIQEEEYINTLSQSILNNYTEDQIIEIVSKLKPTESDKTVGEIFLYFDVKTNSTIINTCLLYVSRLSDDESSEFVYISPLYSKYKKGKTMWSLDFGNYIPLNEVLNSFFKERICL